MDRRYGTVDLDPWAAASCAAGLERVRIRYVSGNGSELGGLRGLLARYAATLLPSPHLCGLDLRLDGWERYTLSDSETEQRQEHRFGMALEITERTLAERTLTRGNEPGPLFYRVHKGGRIEPMRLNPQTISDMLQRRTRQTGLAKLTPHDLRRTTISDLLDAGVDLATVQKLAGHTNANTTARYDRRGAPKGPPAKRRAAAKFHVPWQSATESAG